MSAAEIDTRRRSLGLSLGELAGATGISERTLRYWVSGEGEPRDPASIMDRLTEVAVTMGDLVDSLSELALEAFERTGERRAVVVRHARPDTMAADDHRGLPLGAHAMAMSWLADDLRADGFEVVFEWA